MTENVENTGGRRMGHGRIAAWVAAALLLLLPLAAMQFTNEVNWNVGDFISAGFLLFGSLGAYEVAARQRADTAYRAGVGLAIAATFLLIWGNGALYITDSAADAGYYGVAVIGIVGVVIALFRPGAGARAMLAAVFALVLACVIALVTGMVPNPYASTFEVVGITGFYAVLYAGAAWLLREAARGGLERDAEPEG